jgi:glycosyltransferase involved in cell wall biosynthesis
MPVRKIGLFLDADRRHGGTFQYNRNLLEGVASLPKDCFEVVLGYTSRSWREHLEEFDLPTRLIPRAPFTQAAFQLWKSLRLPVGLWRRLNGRFHPKARAFLLEGCDLWIFPSQEDLSFQLPLPALVSILDLMHRYERRFPESGSPREYRYREWKYSNICRWSKGVIVDAELGREQVVESYGIASARVHVLPQVAPSYLHSTDAPPDFEVRYRLPRKFLFYPAQFWEHKNHKNLLRAVARVKSDCPDVKLVLAGGKKNAYDEVVRLGHELGLGEDLLFLGYVPDADVAELYRRARALIMPTYYGPTNIPPLEAFVAGCPVAASGVYAMPEQVGDAALLFDPGSVEQMAESIRRLWTDDELCARLVERGKRRAASWGQPQFNARLQEIVGRVVSDLSGSSGSP